MLRGGQKGGLEELGKLSWSSLGTPMAPCGPCGHALRQTAGNHDFPAPPGIEGMRLGEAIAPVLGPTIQPFNN